MSNKITYKRRKIKKIDSCRRKRKQQKTVQIGIFLDGGLKCAILFFTLHALKQSFLKEFETRKIMNKNNL